MTSLELPERGVAAIIDDIRSCGAQGVESGAMLLTPIGSAIVSTVALFGVDGVVRRWGQLIISSVVIDQLFSYAEDRDLRARAQVHSHAGPAFMSTIDRAGNIRLKGFTVAVIPTFKNPPEETDQWGWWTYDGSSWADTAAARERSDLPVTVVLADAGGIRER